MNDEESDVHSREVVERQDVPHHVPHLAWAAHIKDLEKTVGSSTWGNKAQGIYSLVSESQIPRKTVNFIF